MKKYILLSIVFLSVLISSSYAFKNSSFVLDGKLIMEKLPIDPKYLSKESGGLLTAEEAYSEIK